MTRDTDPVPSDTADTTQARIDNDTLKPDLLGFENLLEDLIGLNIRALKSIWTIFLKPKDYFLAARKADWLNAYTPSFRIWLGLFALIALLKLVFTNEEAEALKSMVEFVDNEFTGSTNSDALEEKEIQTIVTDMVKFVILFMPVVLALAYAGLASFLRCFGHPTGYILRLRYIFTLAIPPLILNGLFLVLYAIRPDFINTFVDDLSGFALLGLVAVTAYRGPITLSRQILPAQTLTRWGALWRSALISLLIESAFYLSFMLTFIFALFRYGVPLVH